MGPALIPTELNQQLVENGRKQQSATESGDWLDYLPVLKLFAPDSMATWLLAHLFPNDSDIAFALCDLGIGRPELGEVDFALREVTAGDATVGSTPGTRRRIAVYFSCAR